MTLSFGRCPAPRPETRGAGAWPVSERTPIPDQPATIPPHVVEFATRYMRQLMPRIRAAEREPGAEPCPELAFLAMAGNQLPLLRNPHVPDYVQAQLRALALGTTEGEGNVYMATTREWLAEVFARASPAAGSALTEALPPGEHWLVYVEFRPDGMCYPWVAVIEVEES